MRGGEPVQVFTVIGLVEGGEPYAYNMGGDFVPFRRSVAFLEASEAPIRPLLPRLSFTEASFLGLRFPERRVRNHAEGL